MTEATTPTIRTVQYDVATASQLAGQAQAALTSAKALVIDSPTMYELAAEELQQVKALQKKVEEQRTSITVPLNAALRAVNDLFRAPAEFLVQAEQSCKKSMLTYQQEQERIAAEERRRAEQEAAAERERLAAIQREQEQQARAAEAAAAAAAAAGDAAAAAQHAAAAEAAMAEAQASELTAAVVTIPTATAPVRATGISGRTTYKAQVDDLLALVKAVAEGKAPLECICADEKFLSAQARAFKKAGALYPGVTAVAERSIAARAA